MKKLPERCSSPSGVGQINATFDRFSSIVWHDTTLKEATKAL